MSSTAAYPTTSNNAAYSPSDDTRSKGLTTNFASPSTSSLPKLPTSDGLRAPAGQLLKGATDAEGKLTAAALMVGIKLDLEAEVHLTARVRGDIIVGLY
ncbi:hypothetical protein L207DRAFT_518329 [Hyaloscypha variabilis F]|uniref:Uncharacterized protein n=1 Tax=Hyaloscypha variabilis (strain UAMH 11265 / GT02V1 / F) TaxID=1149755 RepID=A0A2J6R328_HYAVF|nr:hypothetical protein L207DRAFT_518329 [Hyaloscypha variabilis F]